MKFTVKNLVRGTGLAYFNISIEDDNLENQPIFSVKASNGNNVPCAQYDTSRWTELEDYVLVIPLLSVTYITLSCEGCKNTVSYSTAELKWMSRWNYKAQKDVAQILRDFEKPIWANNTRLHYHYVMVCSENEEVLIKGFVNFPKMSKFPELIILDSSGNVIENPDLFKGETFEITQEDLQRREIPFTLRMPVNEDFCLYAKSYDSTRSAFVFFDKSALEAYEQKYPSLWDVCKSRVRYDEVVRKRELFLKTGAEKEFAEQGGPKFSIVVPLYKTPIHFFREMVKSVQRQFYKNWELVLVNASPEDNKLKTAVDSIEDERVKVIEVSENSGISANANVGIDECTGDYIGFLNHDDTLDPRCLSLFAKKINKHNNSDVVYCDHDWINPQGDYVAPVYKPSFNLYYFLTNNYICHFVVVKTCLAKSIKLNPELDDVQDYDFLLRLHEKGAHFEHVDEILYHCRQAESLTETHADAKDFAQYAGRKALQNYFIRQEMDVTVSETPYSFCYNPIFHVSGNPKVSIIIPNNNNVDVLKTCISSILEKTLYDNYEIIIVENGSEESSIFEYYEQLKKECTNVKIVTWKEAFNFSKVCNFGAEHAEGEFLLFLNNDTEVIDPKWLDYMIGDCQRDDVGAVGAKLLYPDDTVQHAGVTYPTLILLDNVAGPYHLFTNLDRHYTGYCNRAVLRSSVEAVTGACLMTKRSIFEMLHGFDDEYEIDYSDIDYCFKVTNSGLQILYEPNSELYHHESLTLGIRKNNSTVRFIKDQDRLRTLWAEKFLEGDHLSGSIQKLI